MKGLIEGSVLWSLDLGEAFRLWDSAAIIGPITDLWGEVWGIFWGQERGIYDRDAFHLLGLFHLLVKPFHLLGSQVV